MSERMKKANWSRWHVGVRVAGMTGLLLAGLGLVLYKSLESQFHQALGVGLGCAGVVLVLAALFIDVKVALQLVSGERGAFGSNVALQLLLATLLLIGANVFSYYHYVRRDCTRDHVFTIDQALLQQLRELRDDTTIVVLQQHQTLGQLASKPDNFDSAAERKVVEKVKDLVEQFQELGPRFKVVVLDVQDEDYSRKLARVTENAPALRKAIDAAPENSVFFFSHGKVQRLGFQDIYQLDKQASQEANGGRGNLVLINQGMEPFAHKILNLDEKKPKVAVAVVHEILGLNGSEEIGLAGLKKALAARGFDSQDIVLKRWGGFGPPEPAVFTIDESKFELLEIEVANLTRRIKALEDSVKLLTEQRKLFKDSTLDELTKKFAEQLGGRKLTENDRRLNLEVVEANLDHNQARLQQLRTELVEKEEEKRGLNVDSLAEKRRITDLKAKTERMLADCDLLLVPRMTLRNVAHGNYIPNRLHRLDEAQALAIREFLKAGKPVLACFGPANESPEDERGLMPFGPPGPDTLENELSELGIRFGKDTVIYDIETRSLDERQAGLAIPGGNVAVPPVVFDWKPGVGQTLARSEASEQPRHPIRDSMRLTVRSLGKDRALELRVRNPRPITVDKNVADQLAYDPRIMMTGLDAAAKDQPFLQRGDTRPDAMEKKSDIEGPPYPIGVALTTTVPTGWYTEPDAKPAKVRIAAIGHGGLFSGNTLAPAEEKLFFDVCNWLLGRDDLLTKHDKPDWQYPRVNLSESQISLWQWGTRLGLPLLFVYLGMVVLLVRRLR